MRKALLSGGEGYTIAPRKQELVKIAKISEAAR
jgi:hypothetical protein